MGSSWRCWRNEPDRRRGSFARLKAVEPITGAIDMLEAEAREIIQCLPRERTLFWYHPDRYAVYLLERHVGEAAPITRVKNGPFAKLLARPDIADIVKRKGNGLIEAQDLTGAWPTDPLCYRLTLGIWGEDNGPPWQQTSRPGANLVLHLNFSTQHDEKYRGLIEQPDGVAIFASNLHPNARAGFHTLAWARIDLDLARGEALIEEIQTDWLRLAWKAKSIVDDLADDPETQRAALSRAYRGRSIDPSNLRTYIEQVLLRHFPTWDQAMLTAALWFLWEEIGITQVWYHTHDCGQRLKSIIGAAPPRSLYSDLPKRFCFERTEAAPAFLEASRSRALRVMRKAGTLRFWRFPNGTDAAGGKRVKALATARTE